MLLPRILQRDRPRRAAVAYAGLVARIRADGWQVENYQFPLIADERRAGSDLLQRLPGWWRSQLIVRSGCCTPPSCALWARA
jgi:hypothetical protein